MPEETNPPQPLPEDPGLPGGVLPDEMFARALQSVRMTGEAGQWTPPTVEEAAKFFPGYEVLAMLGRGAMGVVFKARQLALDRLVAIKLLPLEITVERNFVSRFRREARAMAKLSHPNIIAVHDFGQTSEGQLFFVMEFVEGANLAEIIRQSRLDADHALALTSQVCAALAYAHGKGIVHRDIKPANVLVDAEGRVKMADFGLARLTGPEADIFSTAKTGTGIILGTPAYMAPEQRHGLAADHRADIYSLGVMFYEMLCGQLPRGVFALPSECLACDERLDQIVMRTMQQEPDLRYQSTAEMQADVDSARRPPPAPPAAPPPELSPDPSAKPPAWVHAAIAVAILGALAGAIPFALTKLEPHSSTTPPPATPSPATPPPATPAPTTPLPTTPPPATPPPATPAPATPPPTTPKPEATPPGTPAPRASTPAPKPLTVTGKWLAEQEPQWLAEFAREVGTPFEKGMAAWRKLYLAALDAQYAAATRTGRLDDSVALRAERKLIADGGDVPAADDPATPVALQALRATHRKPFAALDAERISKAKALLARCDAILARNQLLLTQRQRLDEALEIRAKREQLAAAWLKRPADTKTNPVTPPDNSVPLSSGWQPMLTRPEDYRQPGHVKILPDGWVQVLQRVAQTGPGRGKDTAMRARFRFFPGTTNYLMLRDDGSSNNYFALIDAAGAAVRIVIGMKTAGVYSTKTLGSYPLDKPKAQGDDYKLELHIKGDEITVFADDRRLGSVHDTTHANAGSCTFFSDGGEFRDVAWRDLESTAASKPASSPAPSPSMKVP